MYWYETGAGDPEKTHQARGKQNPVETQNLLASRQRQSLKIKTLDLVFGQTLTYLSCKCTLNLEDRVKLHFDLLKSANS